jgi:hypothetical protein
MDESSQTVPTRKSAAPALRNSAGFAWASAGVGVLILTLSGVGWIQLANPIPPEGVLIVLALGFVPAALAMLIGLRNGLQARTKFSDQTFNRVHSSGIRMALTGLGLLVTGAAIFAGDCLRRETQKTKWVQEAQAAVEKELQTADRIPKDMRIRLGPFKGFTGQGVGGALWNIQGYAYLQADRDAHFANATIPVRIYVTEGKITNPGTAAIVIQDVQRESGSLYLNDAPLPKLPIEGLRIMVSHPVLRRL